MKNDTRNNRPSVAVLLVPVLLALAGIACVPTEASMSVDGSTLAAQVAEQVLTFILDFSRQALAAFLL